MHPVSTTRTQPAHQQQSARVASAHPASRALVPPAERMCHQRTPPTRTRQHAHRHEPAPAAACTATSVPPVSAAAAHAASAPSKHATTLPVLAKKHQLIPSSTPAAAGSHTSSYWRRLWRRDGRAAVVQSPAAWISRQESGVVRAVGGWFAGWGSKQERWQGCEEEKEERKRSKREGKEGEGAEGEEEGEEGEGEDGEEGEVVAAVVEEVVCLRGEVTAAEERE
ncbi:unnamed protein product [Closterium sp. Naga37s-1]|nr:unnamed protein product [Closterium sp. Naga37s-1]